MHSMEGRHVLIAGASQGLGRALAFAASARGANVTLVARSEARLREVAEELGDRAYTIVADVAGPSAAARIAGEASDRFGAVDVLINNASTLGAVPMPALFDTTDEVLRDVFDVNLFAPFALARAVGGGMVARGRGVIVNISSDAAVEAYEGWGAYGASKAALDHLTRIWAAEVEGSGVRFLAVDPGEMNTAMHAAALPDADPATLEAPEVVAARVLRMIEGSAGNGARLVASHWAAKEVA